MTTRWTRTVLPTGVPGLPVSPVCKADGIELQHVPPPHISCHFHYLPIMHTLYLPVISFLIMHKFSISDAVSEY